MRVCAFESGAGAFVETRTKIERASVEPLAGISETAAGTGAWLRVDRLLGELRIPADSAAGRLELENDLERRREQEENYQGIRHGWCLGDETVREELPAQARAMADVGRIEKLKVQPDLQNEFYLQAVVIITRQNPFFRQLLPLLTIAGNLPAASPAGATVRADLPARPLASFPCGTDGF